MNSDQTTQLNNEWNNYSPTGNASLANPSSPTQKNMSTDQITQLNNEWNSYSPTGNASLAGGPGAPQQTVGDWLDGKDPTQPQINAFQNPIKQGLSDIGSAAYQRFQNVWNPPAGSSFPEKVANVVGQGAGFVQDVIGEGMKGATGIVKGEAGMANDLFPGVTQPIHQAAVGLLQSPIGQAGLQAIKGGADMYSQWAQSNPRVARQLENVVNVGLLFPEAVIGKASGLLDTVTQTGKDIGSAVKGGAEDIMSGIKSTATDLTQTGKSLMSGKTEAEILATAPKDVPNLSAEDRKIYQAAQQKASDASFTTQKQKLADEFRSNKNMTADEFQTRQSALDTAQQAEKDKIIQQHADMTSKIETDLQAKSDASLKETKALKTKLDKTSVAEAGSYQKPAQQVFKNNSAQFQKLFENEFTAEKQAIPLKQADLVNKFDAEFAGDPRNNLKDKLGLDPNGKDITAKDFYDKIRSLKISAPGGKFTESDLAISRSRGILGETLRDNGVNLDKANKFWSEWKPLQKQILQKVKPYDSGYETGKMANILKSSASEIGDAKNAKFISSFESQLGQKIGGKTRSVMEQLSTAEKNALADKVAAEEAKTTAKATRDTALESLQDKYTKAQDALDKAKLESTRNATSENINKVRALEKAQADADAALKSRNIETERQAGVTKSAIIKKVLKIGMTGSLSIEGIKKLITGSF